MDKNLDDYVDGKLTVSNRRVFTTNWVGNAWEIIFQSKDIIRFFKKCEITTNVDDSENSLVNILGVEDYVKFYLETSSSEESEDEEWVTDNNDNGHNNCDTYFQEGSTSNDENED